jgi:Zn ribbon nucleic-acid-binding protein
VDVRFHPRKTVIDVRRCAVCGDQEPELWWWDADGLPLVLCKACWESRQDGVPE